MMTNAKEEFLEEMTGKHLKCAMISHYRKGKLHLKVGYSSNELDQFLESLDFTYDSGYGGQELYGTIWYKDATWSDRGEYDGSEWWQYNSVPDIPPNLLK